VSFAAITLCVASQRVIPKVSVHNFVIDSVRKLLDEPLIGPTCQDSMDGFWKEKLIVNQASKIFNILLCDSKIHYSVAKSPPLDPNRSQMNPVHTLTTYF
jgi:hypothetical protein